MIKQESYSYHVSSVAERIVFESISYNSKEVDENTLFFVKGATFKAEYLNQAIEENGLKFYVSETPFDVAAMGIIVTDIRKAMAVLSRAFYQFPNEKLKIIAFTGTKGKTTAAYFTKNILAEATGQKTAMISTMNTTLDGLNYFKSALTTPESLDLFRMMDEAIKNGMTHLVMEVSSQAYKLDRVYGLNVDVGVFLNISPDHIGPLEHPNFEDYFYCKRQLLHHSEAIVLNHETDYFNLLVEETIELGKPYYVYSDKTESADFFYQSRGFDFSLTSKENGAISNSSGEYKIQLTGDFNAGNAVSAIIAATLVGANGSDAKRGVEHTTVPGRMEILRAENGAKILVDYAHNKISLEVLLTEVKRHLKGKLVVLIGAPGNKGENRRRDFGVVLSDMVDEAILTMDDPNSEDPMDIAKEIQGSITSDIPVSIELNREEAIRLGISKLTSSEDVLVLAGKGADLYQIIDGVKTPYIGDYEVARKWT
jgi:UDP-N-acetylmuramoyl-L-alanyl-D-glutamate-L-lysine ligase